MALTKSRQLPGLYKLFASAGISPWLLTPGLLLLVQSALLTLAPLALVYGLIDSLPLLQEDDTAPQLTRYIQLTVMALTLALLLAYAGNAWFAWITARLLAAMRARVGAALALLSLGEWMEGSGPGMRQRVEDNLDGIGNFVAQQIPIMARAICVPLILIVALLLLDWRLALISLVPVPAAVALVLYSARRKETHNIKAQYYAIRAQLHQRMIEFFASLPAVKMFAPAKPQGTPATATEPAPMRYNLLDNAIQAFATFMQHWMAVVIPPWARFYSYLTNASLPVLALGVWLYQQHSLSGETLLLFALLGTAYIRPIFALANSGSQLALVKEAVQQFEATLQRADKSLDTPAPEPADYGLVVTELSFAYAQHQALHGVSLTLPAKQTIALVGRSGSGKSTLALLLAGVLQPQSGQVLLGGVDLATMPIKQRNRYISLVLQHPSLLATSLKENIALQEQPDYGLVTQALHAAQLDELIARLPKGVDTSIGTDLSTFSGGETQRIQIARAIYKHAPVVILDESTAFCDADNEAAIQQAIARLDCQTLIVITHRLHSVTQADMLVVLDKGRVVATGTHRQLLVQCDLYQQLWQAQQV